MKPGAETDFDAALAQMVKKGKTRDPLVLVYETLKQAIRQVHGKEFLVMDALPEPDRFRKKRRNAANLSYLSGKCEKGLMREYVPHKMKKNYDGTFTVATETLRMEYLIRITFYSDTKGMAEKLSTDFILFLEEKNELPLIGDLWQESMNIFLAAPPKPPEGEADLWWCVQEWQCTEKLLTEEVVHAIDVSHFRVRIENR